MTRIVGELLRDAAERLRASGSESALLDAELLLGHVLHVDRASLLAHPEAQVGPGQKDAFEAAVVRRLAGEPVAYIRGTKEFYGLAFMIDARALIPRPETELLVELALERVRAALLEAPRPQGSPPLTVWDVGTGSGAITIALAAAARRRGYADEVRFLATDISADALALAIENAVGHGVADVIEFAQADLLRLPSGRRQEADVLVANLPYIPSAVVPELPIAASFEPRSALDGGEDGLTLIARLLEHLPFVLAERGVALVEIGADQGDAARALTRRFLGGWSVQIHADLGGQPRVVELSRTGSSAGSSETT
ncbi:MAG TPA: peptide chain release factor N(5)-glutamine methyltransferase [Candidatus Caenarcaniphilales bacterium]|nr:peptide chain release factor N(5)-glutamine methyltransferase [Candidatus Caenarcaniphilales bacterium]